MNHKRLYIGDLGPDVNEQDLRALLTTVCAIVGLDFHPATAGAHGFALVETSDAEQARAAVQLLNGYDLKGLRLIAYTIPPRSRPRNRTP